MGYFANTTDGDSYYQKFCEHCKHNNPPDNPDSCPVWTLHILWNYDQIQDPTKKEALDALIPTHQGQNSPCKMFVRKPHDLFPG